jgi:hypothetical protein
MASHTLQTVTRHDNPIKSFVHTGGMIRRMPILFATLLVVAHVLAAPAVAQDFPIAVGLYDGLGSFTSHQPLVNISGDEFHIGVFVDYSRHRFRPGLDLRHGNHTNAGFFAGFGTDAGDPTAGRGGGGEWLVGPRLSFATRWIQPYAEGLFGQAHDDIIQPVSTSPVQFGSVRTFSHGSLKMGVVGLDLFPRWHAQWRVLEFAAGSYGGQPSFSRRTITTGVVFRFP